MPPRCSENGEHGAFCSRSRALFGGGASNRAFLAELDGIEVPVYLSLYEELCKSPDEQCQRVATALGLSASAAPAGAAQASSRTHIAVGNKDYINHTRGRVRCDDRWFHDDLINACYALMPSVHRFNRELHAAGVSELRVRATAP